MSRGDLSFQSQLTQCSSDERNGKTYTMQGVRVHFPHSAAYPSQVALMDKIIRSLRNKQNCLLESPTGSGKSLALLCATLAWQKKELDEIQAREIAADEADRLLQEQEQKARNEATNANKNTYVPETNRNVLQSKTNSNVVSTGSSKTDPTVRNHATVSGNSNNDDFQPQKRFRMSNVEHPALPVQNGVQHIYIQLPDSLLSNGPVLLNLDDILKSVQSSTNPAALNATPTVPTPVPVAQSQQVVQKPKFRPRIHRPKIFYCTRTHKQVKQITQELASTGYRDARMCILSSREQTCIHPRVSKQPNKNEGCQDLLKNPGGVQCSLYLKTRGFNQYAVKSSGLDSAWDLEDMVSLGKRLHFCPYFGLRELMQSSDIIFCPYNYLTDPLIRSSMDISLKGNVIILDEGHNIEEFAREAASFSVNQDDLQEAIKDLETIRSDENQHFAQIFSRMSTWIDRNSKNMSDYSEFDRSGKVLAGHELVAVMTEFGAGSDNLGFLNQQFSALSDTEENKFGSVSSATLHIIKGLLFTLNFLYRDQLKYMADYRCVIVKTMVVKRRDDSGSGWRQKTITPKHSFTYTLNFWCLNPGVCFSDFHNLHSLIVTSGTLSPMVSFESELALSFPVAFEANHVIRKSQIWVGSIGCGPNNVPLKAVYQNTESLQFQDELGQVVLQVCQTVPHGVLCFFPSYSNLDKMTARWQLTGLMERIERTKFVVTEPRANNKAHFEEILQDYYSAIEEGEGALFFAVYRGKVSEGLNFSDDNARAVITIGIPYPNLKDIQVDLKQKYNNQHYRSRSLMSGRDWYEAQAFRALNQALGRCIRHRGDWGALILVDQRFQTNVKYAKSLSKWVRNELCNYDSFPEAMDSLKFFAKNAQKLNESVQSAPQNVSFSEPNSSLSKSVCVNTELGEMSLSEPSKSHDSTRKETAESSPNGDCSEVIELSSSPELF